MKKKQIPLAVWIFAGLVVGIAAGLILPDMNILLWIGAGIIAVSIVLGIVLSLAGLGVSMITESSVCKWNPGKTPDLYYIDDELCRRKICIAYPESKYLSAAARELINIITMFY